MASIVVIAELEHGRVSTKTYELLAMAEEIGKDHPFETKVVVLADDAKKPAGEIARNAGVPVVAVQNPMLATYSGELYKALLAEILPKLNPVFILVAQSTQGMDFSPGLAVRLGAGCVTGVDSLVLYQNEICFCRNIYHGKIELRLTPSTHPTVVTVQPGAFKTGEKKSGTPGPIEFYLNTAIPKRTRPFGVKRVRQEDAGLAQADVVVVAGRGLGKEENLEMIRKLATLFPRSAVACSRPLCDRGWMDYKRQVGMTGATVSPKLYIACGISGAIQHTVGMHGSGFVVAISTDPDATIFDIADVCIVEDLTTFIPTFLALCEEDQKRRRSEDQKMRSEQAVTEQTKTPTAPKPVSRQYCPIP